MRTKYCDCVLAVLSARYCDCCAVSLWYQVFFTEAESDIRITRSRSRSISKDAFQRPQAQLYALINISQFAAIIVHVGDSAGAVVTTESCPWIVERGYPWLHAPSPPFYHALLRTVIRTSIRTKLHVHVNSRSWFLDCTLMSEQSAYRQCPCLLHL